MQLIGFVGILVAGLAYFWWLRRYTDVTKRLPPSNTPRGKEGRIVGAVISLSSVVFMFLFWYGASSNGYVALSGGMVAGVIVAVPYTALILYLKTRKSK